MSYLKLSLPFVVFMDDLLGFKTNSLNTDPYEPTELVFCTENIRSNSTLEACVVALGPMTASDVSVECKFPFLFRGAVIRTVLKLKPEYVGPFRNLESNKLIPLIRTPSITSKACVANDDSSFSPIRIQSAVRILQHGGVAIDTAIESVDEDAFTAHETVFLHICIATHRFWVPLFVICRATCSHFSSCRGDLWNAAASGDASALGSALRRGKSTEESLFGIDEVRLFAIVSKTTCNK